MTPGSPLSAVELADVNLVDPRHFADGPPHHLFDLLRREDPVHWNGLPDADGFWALTKHADVVSVSRDQANFTSAAGITLPRLEPEVAGLFADMMIFTDPPRHTQLRSLINKGFSPRMVGRLEEKIRQFSIGIVDTIRRREAFDFITEVAAELPAQVIADIIGVPEGDRKLVVRWAGDLFGREEPDGGQDRFFNALQELFAYVSDLRAKKLLDPEDDIFSRLLHAEVEGAKLTETEFLMFFTLLASAGFETTHSLLAQTMWLFLERPDIAAKVGADLDRLPAAVEELLRYVSPVNFFARTAVRDVELRGRTISAGDYVLVWYSAANRDPEVFTDPHEFDLDRPSNQHVAFGGGGPHYCLGAHLGRLESRIFLEQLFVSGLEIELSGPAVRFPSVFVNALKELPVRTVGGR